jgi:hypothetical protein
LKYFINITAWLATLAGLTLTIISAIPEVWEPSSVLSWLWTSSGWIVALIFCIILSIERHSNDEKGKVSEVQHKKLQSAHSKMIGIAKAYKLKMQEAVAEKRATHRSNEYLLDKLEQSEPKPAIRRKEKE